ncbi:acyl-CoA desaturase [Arthrobacter sp. H14]|uniref:fatty acid desaturase family protein n=1 Tax=Arthrobacter sp. H14 TaxID=1312959 RepID=UPI00056A0F52
METMPSPSQTANADSVRPPKANKLVQSYTELMKSVRDAGLLQRRRRFYITLFIVLMLLLAATWTGFALLGDSWFQLLIAAALGVIFTQLAFMAHEAAHRQIFASGPVNDRAARVLANLVVGISYSWWMNKHNRHHANPNIMGKDPDVDMKVLSFDEESASGKRGLAALWTRNQGYMFFPLLLLEGVNLHVTSWKTVLGRGRVEKRWVEIAMLGLRMGAYLAVVFMFLPVGLAFAFIGIHMAVFGVYMGASFAPNHKGMPVLPRGSKVDFLSKQVLTSRNIRGGTFMSHFMGGLNYQIEHHLFPNMPRPHLRKARQLVRAHCQEHGIKYTETSLLKSYSIVVQYLNRVGLSARDPFDCPLIDRYRPR